MTAQTLAEYLGGRQTLGRDIRSDLDLEAAIRIGLPVKAAESVVKTGALRAPELHELVIPRRTLAHRKSSGGQLSSAQSDRLARVVRVVASAEGAIGARDKAATLAPQAQPCSPGTTTPGSPGQRCRRPPCGAGTGAHRAWAGRVARRPHPLRR